MPDFSNQKKEFMSDKGIYGMEVCTENNALKNTIREMQSSLEALNEEILRNRAEHIKRISEFDEAKKRYCEVTKKVRLLEKEYKKKIDSLINRIIKRT